jgi:hypothetical protein
VSRAGSFSIFGAFGPGTLGLAIAGPVAALVGASRVLAVGAAWSALSTLVVLTLPAIRALGLPPRGCTDGRVAARPEVQPRPAGEAGTGTGVVEEL